MACRFIDASNYRVSAPLLRWAGAALHIDWLRDLANEDLLRDRTPAKPRLPGKDYFTKHAAWLPDSYVRFLADQFHERSPIRRRKAFYLYFCAVGGVRFGDSEHVIRMTHSYDAGRRSTLQWRMYPLHCI